MSVIFDLNGKGRSKNGVTVLAHEFGHIKYQVPKLSEYIKFYNDNYSTGSNYSGEEKGHIPSDKSGRMADKTETQFIKNYREYLKKQK